MFVSLIGSFCFTQDPLQTSDAPSWWQNGYCISDLQPHVQEKKEGAFQELLQTREKAFILTETLGHSTLLFIRLFAQL